MKERREFYAALASPGLGTIPGIGDVLSAGIDLGTMAEQSARTGEGPALADLGMVALGFIPFAGDAKKYARVYRLVRHADEMQQAKRAGRASGAALRGPLPPEDALRESKLPDSYFRGDPGLDDVTSAKQSRPKVNERRRVARKAAEEAVGKTFALGTFIATVTAVEILDEDQDLKCVTYVLEKPGKPPYAGRACGFGPVSQILERRFSNHERIDDGYVLSRKDKVDDGLIGLMSIWGREQQLLDSLGGAESDWERGDPPHAANKNRAVAKDKRIGRFLHELSNYRFGQLHKYTGD